MVLVDLVGRKFGKLTVIGRAPNRVRRGGASAPEWYCKCDCGNPDIKVVEGGDLKRKKDATVTCGCGGDGIGGNKNKTHGFSNESWYSSYLDMHRRCYNNKSKSYLNYGDRGIEVSWDWRKDNPNGIFNFLKDMGEREESFSIERIDVNGNYCKENCTWIKKELQSKNTRVVKRILFKGVVKNLSELAIDFGTNPSWILYHLNRNKNIDWIYERSMINKQKREMRNGKCL